MQKRPSWPEYYLSIAKVVSTRSTCERKQVGAVITDHRNRPISFGYNEAPAGCPGCEGASICAPQGKCDRTIHAELNAILHADRNRLEGATMYLTLSPCNDCMKFLINAGIERVFYSEQYRVPPSDYGRILLIHHPMEY